MTRPFRRYIYKETADDWCPSFQLNYRGILKLVKVVYSHRPDDVIVISVFGGDDMSMILTTKSQEEAEKAYTKILDERIVNQDWLETIGFEFI